MQQWYTVYALVSLTNGWLYIGLTNDLARRLREHNRGYNRCAGREWLRAQIAP